AVEWQAPGIDVCWLLLVFDNPRRQAATRKEICKCRILDGARKCKLDPNSGCVNGKNRADLRERRHLLNIRPQVVEHGMLVKNAEATPDRCLFISWRKSESETRAEALERRVRVELVHRAQCRESRIELLRLLRQYMPPSSGLFIAAISPFSSVGTVTNSWRIPRLRVKDGRTLQLYWKYEPNSI